MTRPCFSTGAAALGALLACVLAGCGSGSAPASGSPTPPHGGSPGTTAASPTTGATDLAEESPVPSGTSGPGGGATAAPASGHSPDASVTACSLVTEQEASAALGTDPGSGQASTAGGATYCLYGTSPELVSVDLVPSGGKADYQQALSGVPAGSVVEVAEVGTAAFGVFKGPAAEIWFCQGDALVEVGLIDADGSTPPGARATALAKAAAGRM